MEGTGAIAPQEVEQAPVELQGGMFFRPEELVAIAMSKSQRPIQRALSGQRKVGDALDPN
jgi:hypothetical protein